jgi:hypothetical protein
MPKMIPGFGFGKGHGLASFSEDSIMTLQRGSYWKYEMIIFWLVPFRGFTL